MNKWTPLNGKSDFDTVHPDTRIYSDDYAQFCHELGCLLESWSAHIVAENNEITIVFPGISSFSAGTLRDLSVHKEGCKSITGDAKALLRIEGK